MAGGSFWDGLKQWIFGWLWGYHISFHPKYPHNYQYIYMIILWMVYIYSISMVYLWYIMLHQKNTHMLKLELRWVCFAGVIIYLSISLGLSTRGLYANVNGENAHEQWHFGGCFTHFQTNSLEDMLCFTRVRGCFSTFSCGYGYGSTPIIPEGLFQRRFVYR
jgi:hypothetical protein